MKSVRSLLVALAGEEISLSINLNAGKPFTNLKRN